MTPFPPLGPFGPYELIELLGQGSYGAVYRARLRSEHLRGVGDVALKLFKPPTADVDPAWYANRLRSEIDALQRLKHDNVVGFHHASTEQGRLYIEMELVDGPSLGRLMRDTAGPLPPAAVVQLALQLCAGLEAAHDPDGGEPIVHRDFKPDNVLLSRQGVAKISDFGLAKVATGGTASMSLVVGTACYVAPEQLDESRRIDHRVDLFALGVVLAEAVLGRPLFPRDSVEAMYVIKHRLQGFLAEQDVVVSIDAVVPGLGPVVNRLLAREPEDRFADAVAVERAVLDGVPAGLRDDRRAMRRTVRAWSAAQSDPGELSAPRTPSAVEVVGVDKTGPREDSPATEPLPSLKELEPAPEQTEPLPPRGESSGEPPRSDGPEAGPATEPLPGRTDVEAGEEKPREPNGVGPPSASSRSARRGRWVVGLVAVVGLAALGWFGLTAGPGAPQEGASKREGVESPVVEQDPALLDAGPGAPSASEPKEGLPSAPAETARTDVAPFLIRVGRTAEEKLFLAAVTGRLVDEIPERPEAALAWWAERERCVLPPGSEELTAHARSRACYMDSRSRTVRGANWLVDRRRIQMLIGLVGRWPEAPCRSEGIPCPNSLAADATREDLYRHLSEEVFVQELLAPDSGFGREVLQELELTGAGLRALALARSPVESVDGGAYWSGCARDEPRCPEEFVGVPRGGRMTAPGFSMERFEVSVANYRLCVDAGKCSAPGTEPHFCEPEDNNYLAGREAHPVNCVTADDAATYCSWLHRTLPGHRGWVAAARGTCEANGLTDEDCRNSRYLPWPRAEGPATCDRARFAECGSGTVPVTANPAGASPYGLLNMAGNVREWTVTRTDDNRYTPGGSFLSEPWELHASGKAVAGPEHRWRDLGFRCIDRRRPAQEDEVVEPTVAGRPSPGSARSAPSAAPTPRPRTTPPPTERPQEVDAASAERGALPSVGTRLELGWMQGVLMPFDLESVEFLIDGEAVFGGDADRLYALPGMQWYSAAISPGVHELTAKVAVRIDGKSTQLAAKTFALELPANERCGGHVSLMSKDGQPKLSGALSCGPVGGE